MGDTKDFKAGNWHREKEEGIRMLDHFPSNNPNPVLRIDGEGVILYANKAAGPLAEYWSAREGEKLPQTVVNKIKGILSQKNPEQLEINTEKKTYSVTFCPMPEENCVYLQGFDISPFRQAEEELKKKYEELEEKAGKRNPELPREKGHPHRDIPGKRQKEQALRKNPSFFEALLNTIHAPIFSKDREGKYLECNELFAREIVGFPEEEVIGKTTQEAFPELPPERAEAIHRQDLELLEKGGKDSYETEFPCSDGTVKDFLVSRAAFKDEEGKIAGMIGIMQDLTHRRRVEESLRNTVSFLETLLDDIPSPVFQRDKNGIYLNCNETFARQIMGLPKEKVIGGSFAELHKKVLEELAEIYRKHDMELLEKGGTHYYETRVLCADGIKRDFLFHKAAYKDSSGNVSGVVGVMLDITQRKAAEEIFQEGEQRYSIVAEQTGQLVYDYDIATGEIEWAGAIKELTGYTVEEIQKVDLEGWIEHIHPEDRERAWETHEKCMRIGKKYIEEYRFRRKDGTYFHVEDSGVYLKDEKGRVYRMLGTIKDITERKLAREKLEKSEEKYRTATEQTGQIVFEHDFKNGVIDWAGAIQDLTGYSAEELRKFDVEKWEESVHPEDREQTVERITETIRKGERFKEEYRFRRKDGDYFYVESCGVGMLDEKGNPTRAFGVIKDITEGKLALQKLEESEERYRQATEQTGQLVFDYEIGTGKTDWAGAIEKLTGYSVEEFQKFGKDEWISHIHPQERKRVVESIKRSLETGDRIRKEYRFRRKDGSYFYVEDSGTVLKDELGRPYRVIGVKKDITEQKLAREKLEKSEERYRLIAEHTGQVLYHDNYTTGVIEWAGAIPEITGYGFEEYQEKTVNGWLGLIHPEDRERVMAAHEQCRKEGGDFFEEYRLRKADGSYVTVEDEGVYLKEENGNVCKALGIIKDIAEKKLAQKKLEESEERFRVATEQTGQIVFEHDHVSGILSWAGAITEITGYSVEEFRKLSGKMWAEHIHPEDREEVLAKLREFQKSCNRFRVEYRFRKKDGNYFHVEDSGVYLRDGEGNIRKAVGVIKDITPIKLAAEKLQESEERFRIAAEKTGQLVYDFNIGSEHVKWAGAIEEITGYTSEEIHKLTTWSLWKEHIHPEDYEKAVSGFGNALRSGGGYCQEYRFKQRSGNYIHVEDCGTYLRDKEGRVYRMIGVIKDITERKRGMEELRKSEEKFRIVAEQTGQLVYDYDIPEDKIDWAGAIKELTGNSEEELKNITSLEDWKELIHPEDLKKAVDSYKKCLDTGEKYREEYRLKQKDGSYLDVENRGVFLKDEKGCIQRILGANKDITQIKRSLEKVRESEEKYRSFIQNFKGIAFQGSVDFEPTFVEGLLEEITGYSEEEFLSGKVHWDRVVEEEDSPRILEDAYKLKNFPGTIINREYRIKRKDGKLRWVNEIIQNISDSSGKPTLVQGSIYDVTERKEAEEALARTEEIRKKEIHHRIKNNLQVISSLLELQADHFSEEKVVEAFRESQNRVASMAIIHEELYRGGDTETIDFAAYLRKLTADLLRSYMVRKEDVKLKLDVEEIFLGMDTAIPLGIIVNELVSNSLKHAFPAGRKGEIHVKLYRTEKRWNKSISNITNNNDEVSAINKGNQFILIVSDNGLGFPENIDFTNTDSLGLQLVNTLVEQLEGKIELERNGTTVFRIKFLESGQ